MKTTKSNFDIAIVVCTYNPEEIIFSKVLHALKKLAIPENITIECVIVDNNSAIPILKLPYIQSFLAACSWAKVIVEQRQGLTYARLSGVRSTTAPTIVFVDDDNYLDPNYIKAIQSCFQDYTSVAVWGPGKVVVEFQSVVSDWFKNQFRDAFQHRDADTVEYGCVWGTWTNFYPYGTGQAVKREVLERYCEAVETGTLSSTDRKGRDLSSGGDIQIVWEAIKLGYDAGISPNLRVHHLISARRSNLHYVKRLTFGTSASYLPALFQSFPTKRKEELPSNPSNFRVLKTCLRIVWNDCFQQPKLMLIEIARYLGSVAGTLQVIGVDKNHLAYRIIDLLGLR